jgi:hypothetical protein
VVPAGVPGWRRGADKKIMLNRPLRLGIHHRQLVVGWWPGLGRVAFGLLVTGLVLLLILLYAGVPIV